MTLSKTGVDIRPVHPEDEPQVLELLDAALGGGPVGAWTPELFRWKHAENPFGPSFLLVAEAAGRIVGLRAFMRWRFEVAGRSVNAVRAVDTATHPDYQGRGIFSRLTMEAVDALRDQVDLIFNTPNEKSLPGYLKMGWRVVGRPPISIGVRRPVRFVRGLRHLREEGAGHPDTTSPVAGEPPGPVLEEPAVRALLGDAERSQERLVTPRTVEFLRWRYVHAPALGYRVVRIHEEGDLRGVAIFRIRPRGRLREGTVSELITKEGDATATRRLRRRVARRADLDYVACHLPAGGAWRAGLIPAPSGPTLVVNVLRPTLEPNPMDLRSWALSLGDLEVF
jgi:GNAT superfamily N-acetyltransferase